MVDVLLRAGANINQKSHWWAGGFHVLDDAWRDAVDGVVPDRPRRRARDPPRRAARDDRRRPPDARRRIRPRSTRAAATGNCRCTSRRPSRWRSSCCDRGADINARDVDHESTAAQWMVRDRPEVARVLVKRGAATDILMAAALGDATP